MVNDSLIKVILWIACFYYAPLHASIILEINKKQCTGKLNCCKEHKDLGEILFSIVTAIEHMNCTEPECLMLHHPEYKERNPFYAIVTVPEKQKIIVLQLQDAEPISTISKSRHLTVRDGSRNTWNFDLSTCYEVLKKGVVVNKVLLSSEHVMGVTFNQRSAPFDDRDFSSQQQKADHVIYVSDKVLNVSACKEQRHLHLHFLEKNTSDEKGMWLILNCQFHCAECCWYYPEPLRLPSSVGSVMILREPEFIAFQVLHQIDFYEIDDDIVETELESQALACGIDTDLKIKLSENKVKSEYLPVISAQGVTVIGMIERKKKNIRLTFMGEFPLEVTNDETQIIDKGDKLQLKINNSTQFQINHQAFLFQNKFSSAQSQKPISILPNKKVMIPKISDFQWLDIPLY